MPDYPLNYYFLSQTLASHLMADDNANHLVSQVTAGQIEASDVQVQNVTIRASTPHPFHCCANSR